MKGRRINMKAIYFDMDGTLVDLYNVPNWLECLQREDAAPYMFAASLYDMREMHSLLLPFIAQGITIGVISWTAKNATPDFKRETRRIKRKWVNTFMPYVSEFHVVQYGTPKHKIANIKDSILVDDNADVRAAWCNGATIDATQDIIAELQKIIS